MNVFLINAMIFSRGRIGGFLYKMFHGSIERKNRRPQSTVSHWKGADDLSDPVHVKRNGRIVPDIVCPLQCLMVSTVVSGKLAPFPNILFVPVVFDRLVDYEFRAGDFSFQQDKRLRRIVHASSLEGLFDLFPDVRDLHATVGPYHEVVVERLWKVLEQFKPLRTISVSSDLTYTPRRTELQLNERLVQAYPVIWTEVGYMFREDVFRVIDPHLDRDYFHVTQLEVP
jgi:hypothetical protein